MATTLTQMSDLILDQLNKSSSYPGFYTPTKVTNAINEALAFIAVNMFVAGDGWLTGYSYLTTVTGDTTAAIPVTVALIREIRYKVGDIYLPMTYDDQSGDASYVGSGVQQSRGYRYRLMGNSIVFDPPLGEGGTNSLQIEGVSYPTALSSGSDPINQQFDTACMMYCKYKACSIMAGGLEKEARTWSQEEDQWYDLMMTIVTRRNLKSTTLREFM